ncbi:MAG: hypothetical protein HC869_16725 [Rhodospirillales bacterium]|nr:hypothetical protein [Rhodospirillales bacterium]
MYEKAMPGGSEFKVKHWLSAAPAQIEAVQARVLPDDALRMLTDDAASVFAGFYMK